MEEEAIAGAGGVRVVARICPPSHATTKPPPPPATNLFQVAAVRHDSSSFTLLSFTAAAATSSSSSSSSSSQGTRAATPRKDDLKLDWCYLKHETNHHIFLNELTPLIHRLLRTTNNTNNTCVVTCGSAAKDHLFMGSPDQPGLITMALDQILQFSKSSGGAVQVSSYQVLQDNHIFDTLDPKDHQVLILEDADGRTHLKGLSKVHVKSIEDFAQLTCFATHHKKQPTKASTQLHTRGHQGLIIHITRFDQQGRESDVAKMNFLNLAGYVDPKQKNNGGGVALPNSNKSMYALMNVVQALNSNQSFVPYRQSKVTRILQDSLSKTSSAVLISCLDEVCCQDTVSTLSLASRSSQVVNEQNRLSMIAKSSSKPNINLSMNAKSSSRSFLSSISQPNSIIEKHDRPEFNNNAVKAYRTPIANKRSQPIMHSAKKSGSSLSTSIKMKQKDAKPTTIGSTLLCPSTNSSKETALVIATTAVKEVEEVQSSQCLEIHAPSTDEGFDKTGIVENIVSSEIQKVVSSRMQEEDYSTSGSHAEYSCTNLSETCSSSVSGTLVEKTPVNTTKSSPKLSDRLREISNSLKLLSARPLTMTTKKVGMECIQQINIDAPEPKTPVMHLKFEQAEDPNDTFKARSTGIKKSLVQECLTFLNSANKEQLKSLKGIGEKRANYIIELREESPELFKEIDDLRDIIKMNQKEIKKMMSGIIDS